MSGVLNFELWSAPQPAEPAGRHLANAQDDGVRPKPGVDLFHRIGGISRPEANGVHATAGMVAAF